MEERTEGNVCDYFAALHAHFQQKDDLSYVTYWCRS